MNTDFQIWPEAGSTTAPAVDSIFSFMLLLSGIITIVVASLVLYFSIRYRRGAKVDPTQRPTSIKMELPWMAMSLPVLMFIFVWGAVVAFRVVRPPANTMPVT